MFDENSKSMFPITHDYTHEIVNTHEGAMLQEPLEHAKGAKPFECIGLKKQGSPCLTSPRSNEKNKKSTSKIRELFSL